VVVRAKNGRQQVPRKLGMTTKKATATALNAKGAKGAIVREGKRPRYGAVTGISGSLGAPRRGTMSWKMSRADT